MNIVTIASEIFYQIKDKVMLDLFNEDKFHELTQNQLMFEDKTDIKLNNIIDLIDKTNINMNPHLIKKRNSLKKIELNSCNIERKTINLIDENISVSEDLSIDSDKTNDIEFKKEYSKIKLLPLDHDQIYLLLKDSFPEKYNNFTDLIEYIKNGKTIDPIKINNLPSEKKFFIRRNICLKFYRVFVKIVSLIFYQR